MCKHGLWVGDRHLCELSCGVVNTALGWRLEHYHKQNLGSISRSKPHLPAAQWPLQLTAWRAASLSSAPWLTNWRLYQDPGLTCLLHGDHCSWRLEKPLCKAIHHDKQKCSYEAGFKSHLPAAQWPLQLTAWRIASQDDAPSRGPCGAPRNYEHWAQKYKQSSQVLCTFQVVTWRCTMKGPIRSSS